MTSDPPPPFENRPTAVTTTSPATISQMNDGNCCFGGKRCLLVTPPQTSDPGLSRALGVSSCTEHELTPCHHATLACWSSRQTFRGCWRLHGQPVDPPSPVDCRQRLPGRVGIKADPQPGTPATTMRSLSVGP